MKPLTGNRNTLLGQRIALSATVWLILACSSLVSGLKVSLLTGEVHTSGALAARHKLPGRGRLLANSDAHSWVLSLPVEKEKAVHDTLIAKLQNSAGKVLHALPGDNHAWIVHSSADVIQHVLDEHGEDVEAAPLPPSMKLSPMVDQLILSYQHGDSVKSDQHIHDQFKFLQDTTGPDGEAYVTIKAATTGVTKEQGHSVAAQVEVSLRQALNTGKSSSCIPHVVFKSRYIMTVLCPKHVEFVATWLSSKPEVTWVELQASLKLQDLHSVSHIQSPRAANAPSYPAPDVTSSSLRPFWAAGLDGKGQVVGVVDSGLDLDSCYLYDPKQNDYQNGSYTTIQSIRGQGDTKVYQNNATRKVATYIQYTDSRDGKTDSHGTHVTTSIIGARYGYDPIKQPDYAVGVAPNAKVAFFDLDLTYSNGSSNSALEGLRTVYKTDMYAALRKAGAYVISNSWTTSSLYTYIGSDCADHDYIAWSDPESLYVFSAGNDGYNQSLMNTTGSVNSPATCKNMLTVGAAENYAYLGQGGLLLNLTRTGKPVSLAAKDFIGPRQYGILEFQVTYRDRAGKVQTDSYTFDSFYGEFGLLPGFDSRVDVMGNKSRPVLYIEDACANTRSSFKSVPESWTELIVLVLNVDCAPATVLNHILSDKRAVGTVFFNQLAGTIEAPQYNGKAAASLYVESELLDGIAIKDCHIRVAWFPPSSADPPPTDNVAGFSSFGSRQAFNQEASGEKLARIKPELVTAGYIQAAASDGQFTGKMDQCLTTMAAGTSMAAPQVAGAALLVRQYFMEGFYPTGAKNASNIIKPTGALIKAVLIAGTRALTGISSTDNYNLDPPPSQFQGFGGLDLAQSLPLANKRKGLDLRIRYGNMTTGSERTSRFTVSAADAGKPISVVLAWYDPPAFEGAIQSSVNNLDLLVQGPKNQKYYPNGRSTPDPVNNIEKVFIPKAPAGDYVVTITAKYVYVATGPQRYDVAIVLNRQDRIKQR